MIEAFQRVFDQVRDVVIKGQAHLDLWQGLSKRVTQDRFVSDTAPTFFSLTLDAHLDAALLAAAKVFDKQRRSLKLATVLKSAEAHKGMLPPERVAEMREVLHEARTKLPELESALAAIHARRNNFIAHLDHGVISRPDELVRECALTGEQLQKVYTVAEDILNNMSALYFEITTVFHYVDGDDYTYAWDLIAEGKRERLKKRY
jgi:hypothetical protein